MTIILQGVSMKYTAILAVLAMLLLGACAGFRNEGVVIHGDNSALSSPVSQETHFLKKKIAIARFSNDTRMANSFLAGGGQDGEGLSRAANDILSTKLAATNRFLLIERQEQIRLDQEGRISGIERYNIPADYLIIGSISEFGRNTSGNVGLFDRSKKQTAYAKISLRVVDTHNGMIIHAEEGSGEAFSETGTVLGMGETAGYDDTLTDKAIDAAISSVVNNLISKLADEAWRSYLLDTDNGQLYISGGSLQGISIGDEFDIFARGKVVTNPQTNLPIELPGQKIGRLRVTNLVPGTELTELSEVRIIEGSIEGYNPIDLYITAP